MRKWLCMLLALLMLVGTAQAAGSVSEKGDLISAGVEEDFPGWRFVGESTYGSGKWEGGLAQHCEVTLLRVEDEWLRFRTLHVIMNPIEPGDPVPWDVTDHAPVPLTAEASLRLAATDPETFETFYSLQIREEHLSGCAEFLLQEGERLTDLLIYQTILVATVENEAGQCGLRIAHWDGEQYTRVTATAMSGYVSINEYHSHDEGVEIYTETAQLWAFPVVEGDAPLHEAVWQIGVVMGDEDMAYVIDRDWVCEYDYMVFGETQYNDGYRYGKPAFPVLLEGLDLSAVPASLQEATPLLDASGYACTAQDGVPMYDAPGGTALASCYARLVGTVQSEQEGWVQLLIGGEERGMKAWFRREDLLFDGGVNTLNCGFPSFELDEDWDAESALPGVTEMLAGDELWGMQLIASTGDDGWLVLVNEEFVIEGRAEGFINIGPAWHVVYAQWEAEWEAEMGEDWEEE